MGTRALVILEDGYECRGIYCHMDGYPTNLGIGLVLGYYEADRAHQLMDVGAIGGLRFNIENAKLSHRIFDQTDTDMKTFVMMNSACPDGQKKLHPYLEKKVRHYFAEYVYWGRVYTGRRTIEGTLCVGQKDEHFVEWKCYDVAKGEVVDLKAINPMDFNGLAFKVLLSPLGWQYNMYGTDTREIDSSCTVYCDSKKECYAKIGDFEYAPERDAIRGKDRE